MNLNEYKAAIAAAYTDNEGGGAVLGEWFEAIHTEMQIM